MSYAMSKMPVEDPLSHRTNTAISELARSPLFKPAPRTLSLVECTKLTYRRAKAFNDAYGSSFPFYSFHIMISDL